MPRHNLTPAFCRNATAQPGAERTIYWHTKRSGFGLMISGSGARSWVVQFRAADKFGRMWSRRMTIDGKLPLQAAEKEAKRIQGQVASGSDPLAKRRAVKEKTATTVHAVAQEYFAREGKKLRTRHEREAVFRRHIFPRFGQVPIAGIKRSEIVRLLDHVEDNSGAPAAHAVLGALRRLMNWYATRDDDFRSPIVRGMGRYNPGETARSRILTDNELRAVWAATEGPGVFPAFIRFLLLTACRRGEAARMHRDEIDEATGIWTLPAARNKTKVELVRPLSKAALETLATQPRLCDFVFSSDGRVALAGFSIPKIALDKKCGVMGWRLHDLRRTARSLMSRAGVNADVAERAIGHVIGGVRAVYDRHQYRNEMLHAYELLAAQIDRIVNPQDNVRQLQVKR